MDSSDGLARLAAQYREALATIGQRVVVHQREGSWTGTARDVDDMGRLIVDGADGVRVVAAGDVVHLRADR